MQLTRGKLAFVLILGIAVLGWNQVSVSVDETAVLHIPAGARNRDTFVTLWVVEDAHGVWVRAEDRDRLWLELLKNKPSVELTRAGQTSTYRAVPQDNPPTQTYVDKLFREKYGRADQIRGLLLPRDSVAIRLERP